MSDSYIHNTLVWSIWLIIYSDDECIGRAEHTRCYLNERG